MRVYLVVRTNRCCFPAHLRGFKCQQPHSQVQLQSLTSLAIARAITL